ncbi:EexN family lipoprotein [Salmonella enterica]|nr:EexN family lipoprotein [Salmonella enterica]
MKKLILPLALFLLAGCDSEHPVSWYKEHDQERKAMVEKCRDDAALKVKPDCKNALEAEKDLKVFGKSDDGLSMPKVTP